MTLITGNFNIFSLNLPLNELFKNIPGISFFEFPILYHWTECLFSGRYNYRL